MNLGCQESTVDTINLIARRWLRKGKVSGEDTRDLAGLVEGAWDMADKAWQRMEPDTAARLRVDVARLLAEEDHSMVQTRLSSLLKKCEALASKCRSERERQHR